MSRMEFVTIGHKLADLMRLQQSMAGRPQVSEVVMNKAAEDRTNVSQKIRDVIGEEGLRATSEVIVAAVKQKHGIVVTPKQVYQVRFRLKRSRKLQRQVSKLVTANGKIHGRRKLADTLGQQQDLLAAKRFLQACDNKLFRAQQALTIYATVFEAD